jgi:hypothetical protein
VDIHKPKPWRGWREFLKEFGTIVLGVLVALSAEQSVEWLHRQTEVREARVALRSEVARNVTIARYSFDEDGCLMKGLDQWSAAARGGPHMAAFQIPTIANLETAVWETAKTGAATHMPLAERLSYAHFYDAIANQKWAIDNERDQMLKAVKFYGLDKLTEPEGRLLVQELVQARVLIQIRRRNSLNLIAAGKAMGIEPNPFPAEARNELAAICGPLGIS